MSNEQYPDTPEWAADPAAARLVRVLDEYLADLKAGRAKSRGELLAQHPDLAAQLEGCLAGLEFIHAAERSPHAQPQVLGDFRIVREVGRGGMGAVFEAVQQSLGRRVALKILRFGAVSDPEAIERFRREAETVATLHHTNIVPIFAVGSERGVNYYAMQFIEGRSLAEVLAESKGPIQPDRVAGWGLQAAEALAHAHARGVIHRDVKPSNLLLDRENRLWLTDFGLARRMDDVTLSLTGALLGTPRYMSPEQAAASHKRVDQRTDVFSLGATLYELLTARPAFEGQTPHDVIQQILTAEPPPVREVASSVPRDLETIVMKCLAKKPAERYAAARELADDLRAFTEGRPIRARRAGPIELAGRWLHKQRRSAAAAGAAAAITLVAVLAGLAGWNGYDAWRQAAVKFDAVTPPLAAEILDSRDRVVRVATAPMQEPMQLPAGDYQVRVSGAGTLSQTFHLSLNRGASVSLPLSLSDHLLWPPQDIARGFSLVDFGSGQAMVHFLDDGMRLEKRRPPYLSWTISLGSPQSPHLAEAPGFRWQWSSPAVEHSGHGTFNWQPWIAPEAIDFDGDGTEDLVCAGRHQAWVLAVSGRTGVILWFAGRAEQLEAPSKLDSLDRPDIRSAVLAEPIVSHDCDGDGVRDVIATFIDAGLEDHVTDDAIAARRWVEAISGKTGRSLWRFDLADDWFELPPGENVPYDLRWFATSGGGTTARGGGGAFRLGGRVTRWPTYHQRTGPHVYCPTAAQMLTVAGERRLVLCAGQHLVALDPADGRLAGSVIELAERPGNSPQWADVDGDGVAELVMLVERSSAPRPTRTFARLVVWSRTRGQTLWSVNLPCDWPRRAAWTVDPPQWPLVTDLSGDGRPEIAVPTGGSGRLPPGPPGIAWGELSVLEGASGKPLWSRQLPSMDQQVDHFVAGPDLDEDGHAELFAATILGGDYRVHVDALSGASGRTLWTSSHPAGTSDFGNGFVLAPLRWWRSGADGWPQLVVQAIDERGMDRQMTLAAFSAGTGELAHSNRDATLALPADLDGDGAEDLLLFAAKTPQRLDYGGRMHAVRGAGSQPWQRLRSLGLPVGDFDRDGIRDLARGESGGWLAATSGRSGRSLWKRRVLDTEAEPGFVAAQGDLDGDGGEDLLVWPRSSRSAKVPALHAVSGRSGKVLWPLSEMAVHAFGHVLAAEARDVDGDARPEVIFLAANDHGYPNASGASIQDMQLRVVVAEGPTGRIRWSQPLSLAYGSQPGVSPAMYLAGLRVEVTSGDLDGDGVHDLLVPAIAGDNALHLQALSGHDGSQLWSRLCIQAGGQPSLEHWTPSAIGDLDGDGLPEVVVVEPAPPGTGTPGLNQPPAQITVLAGADGRERWSSRTEARFAHWRGAPSAAGHVLRPQLVRDAAGQRRVAVYFDSPENQVVVVDARGQATSRKLPHTSPPLGIRICDCNGDGTDELVFLDGKDLVAAPADRLDQPLWKWETGTAGQHQLLELRPGRQGEGQTVVLGMDPTDNSVLGLAAATGKLAWRCPGPISRDPAAGVYFAQEIAVLSDSPGGLPLVYYASGTVSLCRQAVPAGAKSPDGMQRGAGVFRAAAQTSGPTTDPRWLRPLPWRAAPGEVRNIVHHVGWATLLSLLLIVIPAGYALLVVRRGQFSLRMLLALPVVSAVVLTGLLVGIPHEAFAGLWRRIGLALLFAPPLVAAGLVVRWFSLRRWRPIAVWLTVSIFVGAIIAAVAIQASLKQAPLAAHERFDLAGWYEIWPLVVYFTSWLMVTLLPIGAATAYGWRKYRGGRAAAAPPAPLEATHAG